MNRIITMIDIRMGRQVNVFRKIDAKAMFKFIKANKKDFKYLIEDIEVPDNLNGEELLEFIDNISIHDPRIIFKVDLNNIIH